MYLRDQLKDALWKIDRAKISKKGFGKARRSIAKKQFEGAILNFYSLNIPLYRSTLLSSLKTLKRSRCINEALLFTLEDLFKMGIDLKYFKFVGQGSLLKKEKYTLDKAIEYMELSLQYLEVGKMSDKYVRKHIRYLMAAYHILKRFSA